MSDFILLNYKLNLENIYLFITKRQFFSRKINLVQGGPHTGSYSNEFGLKTTFKHKIEMLWNYCVQKADIYRRYEAKALQSDPSGKEGVKVRVKVEAS